MHFVRKKMTVFEGMTIFRLNESKFSLHSLACHGLILIKVIRNWNVCYAS